MADSTTNPKDVLNSGTQSLTDILAALQTVGAVPNNYVQPNYTDVVDASVRDLGTIQNQLGLNLTYDRNEIEKIYQDATKAALKADMNSGAEKSYYANLANAQNTALDTIRQQYGSAVAAGANKGMQAANMLSAVLGTTQEANKEATQLAIDKQNRVNQYAQQLAQDSRDALSYSNDVQQQLASLSRQLYNDDIQRKTAELSYNQGINTDNAGVQANYSTAAGNLLGNQVVSSSGVYNNNQSSIAAIQAAIESANAQKYAAENAKQTITYAGGYKTT